MRRAELIMAVVLAIFSAYLMWKSAELPIGWIPDEGPGGGAFPFWLSAGMLLSSLWIILRWFRRVTPQSRSSEPFFDSQSAMLIGLVVGALVLMEPPEKVQLELIALELRAGLDHLGQVSGEVVSEEILDRIFGRFCIGK